MKWLNCAQCEEELSDYLDGALNADEQDAVERHFRACRTCGELLEGMREVIDWGRTFPVYTAPAWLATRIIDNTANTPRVVHETWTETLAAIGRWLIEPRTAMAVFTATMVIGWMGNIAGISPRWTTVTTVTMVTTVVRDPAAIYYDAGVFVNRAYDRAVRTYYNTPLITQIQSRIEQLREIS